MRLKGVCHDPLLEALRARFLELALEVPGLMNEAPRAEPDVLRAESKANIAQYDVFSAINDERQRLLASAYERRRGSRARQADKRNPADIDFVARLVRLESLKLGIRSRAHSEEEAIEASRNIKYEDLPSIERRAAEIVLGLRRVARNNRMEPASRIANQIRALWFNKDPPIRFKKTEGFSLYEMERIPIPISKVVAIAVPILDQLAGKRIASGIPTSWDPRTTKNAGMAALLCVAEMECGTVPIETVYRALLNFRSRGTDLKA
jgi:hypothetical protein